MRSLVRLVVVGAFALAVPSPCVARQRPGAAAPENLPEVPQRAMQKPLEELPEAPRLPVPDEAAVEEARDLIKQAYEDDYESATRNPESLIRKLLAVAGETEDPARRYALFLEAELVAVAAGDCARAMELVDLRADEFECDGLKARVDRLSEFLTPKTRSNPDTLARLYEQAHETANLGLEQDALPQARAAAELAASMAKSTFLSGKAQKNESLVEDGETKQKQTRNLLKTIDLRADLLTAYKTALENLRNSPDDPAANGVVGEYLCFERDEWSKGLASLAKGGHERLAAAAAIELAALAAAKRDAKAIFTAAGKWWQVADSEGLTEQKSTAIKQHAADLYESVRDQLSDPLDRQLAAKRAQEQPVEQAVAKAAKNPPQSGLLGEYFADPQFKVKVREQLDGVLSFDWGKNGPEGVPKDGFCVRWSGSLVPPVAGDYVFEGSSDDGVRIAMNGRLVVDEWRSGGREFRSAPIRLAKGKPYKIVIEYFEDHGGARFSLGWLRPDGNRQVIPTEALVPPRPPRGR